MAESAGQSGAPAWVICSVDFRAVVTVRIYEHEKVAPSGQKRFWDSIKVARAEGKSAEPEP